LHSPSSSVVFFAASSDRTPARFARRRTSTSPRLPLAVFIKIKVVLVNDLMVIHRGNEFLRISAINFIGSRIFSNYFPCLFSLPIYFHELSPFTSFFSTNVNFIDGNLNFNYHYINCWFSQVFQWGRIIAHHHQINCHNSS